MAYQNRRLWARQEALNAKMGLKAAKRGRAEQQALSNAPQRTSAEIASATKKVADSHRNFSVGETESSVERDNPEPEDDCYYG